jgi:hypothetical protein
MRYLCLLIDGHANIALDEHQSRCWKAAAHSLACLVQQHLRCSNALVQTVAPPFSDGAVLQLVPFIVVTWGSGNVFLWVLRRAGQQEADVPAGGRTVCATIQLPPTYGDYRSLFARTLCVVVTAAYSSSVTGCLHGNYKP